MFYFIAEKTILASSTCYSMHFKCVSIVKQNMLPKLGETKF